MVSRKPTTHISFILFLAAFVKDTRPNKQREISLFAQNVRIGLNIKHRIPFRSTKSDPYSKSRTTIEGGIKSQSKFSTFFQINLTFLLRKDAASIILGKIGFRLTKEMLWDSRIAGFFRLRRLSSSRRCISAISR